MSTIDAAGELREHRTLRSYLASGRAAVRRIATPYRVPLLENGASLYPRYSYSEVLKLTPLFAHGSSEDTAVRTMPPASSGRRYGVAVRRTAARPAAT